MTNHREDEDRRFIGEVDESAFGTSIRKGRWANAHHVVMRLTTDDGLPREGPGLRRAAWTIHQFARGLLAFRVADTHGHMLLLGLREAVGRTVQAVEVALRARLRIPEPFEPARIRPILNQGHFHNSLRYSFRQESHHGTVFDLAHDGSSLVDLLGMRALQSGPMIRRVRTLLPRLDAATLRDWVGMPSFEAVEPDPANVVIAAAAALALPDLRGRAPSVLLARRAAAQSLPLPNREMAQLLEVDVRTVKRLRELPVPKALAHAVDQQLRWRTLLASRVILPHLPESLRPASIVSPDGEAPKAVSRLVGAVSNKGIEPPR